MLVISNERDVSVDAVVRELRSRQIPYLRLNTERMPNCGVAVSPTGGRTHLTRRDQTFCLDGVGAVWYRRPERPLYDGWDLSGAEERYFTDQWDGYLAGLASLPARWMNDPHAGQRAESKVLQLERANSLGFTVPPTLVTNDYALAGAFLEAEGGTGVIKPLASSLIDHPDDARFVFANAIDAERLREVSVVLDVAPFIVQKRITAKVDVRVTVIGDRVFAASTRVEPDVVDWRTSKDRRFTLHHLPTTEQDLCRRLVSELGLWFGAVDLALDSDGYWFLEVNQNGEWGWLQDQAGLPIAEALVSELEPSCP